jgi:hypothetical protein
MAYILAWNIVWLTGLEVGITVLEQMCEEDRREEDGLNAIDKRV